MRSFPIQIFKELTLVSPPGLTGRSSIPETVRAHTKHHGVLDAPPEAGHDNRGTRLRPLAARIAPELMNEPPSKEQGRRECRTLGASAAACAVVESTRVSHHGHAGNVRHSPRSGFNGFLRALPGDRACLPPSSLRSLLLRNLMPASGHQDHTTSPSASAPLVLRRCRVHRIPHPTSVTTAKRPSSGTGWRNQ
jgi:hypothetical protein